MLPKLLAILFLSVAMASYFVAPVSAFYFELYYFETDKMVYEVGETIEMVVKVAAEFSETGSCDAYFAVVRSNDSVTVFYDGYSIPSESGLRFLTSPYVIMPRDITPGVIGAKMQVVFNIVVYDEYTQGNHTQIEVDVKRGHLTTFPESPLSVEFGTNTTVLLRIASPHNNNVVLSNETVSLYVQNPDGLPVFQAEASTDSQGLVQLNWTKSMGPPGVYNLTINGAGTASFLPFSESLQVTVQLGASSLEVLSATEQVYCQSSDCTQTEFAKVTVEHFSTSHSPIYDSEVQWNASFGCGFMNNLGNGTYSALIPFSTGPGLYTIGLTATNALYQIAARTVVIRANSRPLLANVTLLSEVVCGTPFQVRVLIADGLSGTPVGSLPFTLGVTVGNESLTIVEGATNSSGALQITRYIPTTFWGTGFLSLIIHNTSRYSDLSETLPIDVLYCPKVSVQIETPIMVNHDAEVRLLLLDPIGSPVFGAVVELHTPDNVTAVMNTTSYDGTTLLRWRVPLGTGLGNQTHSLVIHRNGGRFISHTTRDLVFMVLCPLFLEPFNGTLQVIRGHNVSIRLTMVSEGPKYQLIDLMLRSNDSSLTTSAVVSTDTYTEITLTANSSIVPGPYVVYAEVLSGPFVILNQPQIEVIVIGTLQASFTIVSAFYAEALVVNPIVRDDTDSTPESVSATLYFIDCGLQISLDLALPRMAWSISLPLQVAPGAQNVTIEISLPWFVAAHRSILVFVWMRTRMVISVSTYKPNKTGSVVGLELVQVPDSTSSSSPGSIISPPPILFNGTTSTLLPTARETSLTSCPRLSSGTNNLSTVSANCLTSESGNGHTVLSLKERTDKELVLFTTTSSTVLEVLPKETTPQSAVWGPETTTSVRRALSLRILSVSLRTSLS